MVQQEHRIALKEGQGGGGEEVGRVEGGVESSGSKAEGLLIDLRYWAARYRLGSADIEAIRGLASDLLDEGRDTPALIELYILRSDETEKVGPLFERVCRELAIAIPAKNEAILALLGHHMGPLVPPALIPKGRLEDIGENIDQVDSLVFAVPDRRLVILRSHNGLYFEAYDERGPLWRSARLCWNEFRAVSVERGHLIGEADDVLQATPGWAPFSVDIDSGKHTGGSVPDIPGSYNERWWHR